MFNFLPLRNYRIKKLIELGAMVMIFQMTKFMNSDLNNKAQV